MERAFRVWLNDEAQKGLSVSGVVVKETMQLYNHYKQSGG
jgi:hypothetical protein